MNPKRPTMNSDELVKKHYEDILKNLPAEDADHVRAYVRDREETERRVGRNYVQRKNLLGLLVVILLGGSFVTSVGVILYKVVELECKECEVCEVCPEPPPPPKALKWKEDAVNKWSLRKDDDRGITCIYKQRTMTCWYDDPTPPSIPGSPFEAPALEE
jgi:hypothetical protein